MFKHYYRLVYWKRRIGRALGSGRRGPRRRRPRLAPHLQPFLVFGALVAIAVAASALAGAGYDDFGWARP
ncbi:hypothetical protein ACH4CC_32500 [Streptomyces lydicus]|uniref:hypothetical protein n=1 Tax=Streptomyces lydicus TaxID=47763 RepID=UPI00379C794A